MHLENTRHISEFNQKRADLYISAMEEGVDVRNNELLSFDFKKIQKNPKNIMEIGAGNGYLTTYLSKKFPGSTIYATDASESMLRSIKKIKNIILSTINTIDINSIDTIFSLATFHHIVNKEYILKKLNRTLSPGGFLFIADVNDKTPTQLFFDTVVRKHCITGHNFDFLDVEWLSCLAKKSGFAIVESEVKETPWIFNNEKHMIGFMKKLTGLEISDRGLRDSLCKIFIIKNKNGKILLHWQLGYHLLKKNI